MIKKMDGRDPETGRFLAGNNGGGRPLGSRNICWAYWTEQHLPGVERMRKR
jgi:hypothetical protein